MLAHVFYLLPMPSTTPAWRVNLSSAVFDALAAGMLCAAVGFWSRDTWAGLAAGGAFAFAPLVWQYAVQSEVFALNNLLCAALFLALVRYDASRTLGRACAGAAVAGLALTNQHTAVFFVAPFAVWTLLASASSSRPGAGVLLRPHRLLLLGACGLLGLSPYLFLVVQGGQGAAWGSWGNQRSVSGFLTHLLRREYGTFRLANAPATGHAEFLFRLRLYFGRLPIELPPTGAPLALLGFCWSLTLPGLRRVGLPVACAFGLYVLAFHWLANLPVSTGLYLAIQQRFWPQANLIVCAWFGIGAATAARRLVPRAPGVAAAALAGVLVFWHAGGAGAPKENGAGAGTVSSKENAAGGWWGGAGGRVSGAWPADCVESDLFDQFGAEMLRVIPEGEAALLLTYGDEVRSWVGHQCLYLCVCVPSWSAGILPRPRREPPPIPPSLHPPSHRTPGDIDPYPAGPTAPPTPWTGAQLAPLPSPRPPPAAKPAHPRPELRAIHVVCPPRRRPRLRARRRGLPRSSLRLLARQFRHGPTAWRQ